MFYHNISFLLSEFEKFIAIQRETKQNSWRIGKFPRTTVCEKLGLNVVRIIRCSDPWPFLESNIIRNVKKSWSLVLIETAWFWKTAPNQLNVIIIWFRIFKVENSLYIVWLLHVESNIEFQTTHTQISDDLLAFNEIIATKWTAINTKLFL